MKFISTNLFPAALILVLVAAFLGSAPGSSKELIGKYQSEPYEVTCDTTFDVAWGKAIGVLTKYGLSPKIIDKSSGLITSEKVSFINNYCYENKEGIPANPNSYVVLNNLTVAKPQIIVGEWNILLKEKNGKTSVSINLVNLSATHTSSTTYGGVSTYNYKIASTGVFEKAVGNLICQ